jgi:hypothetical protein
MKNKELFLQKLSDILDKVEDVDSEVGYFSMDLCNWNPDNRNSERKLSYFQVEIHYDDKTNEFSINDRSEPFVCDMHYEDCEERGYCNGDC